MIRKAGRFVWLFCALAACSSAGAGTPLSGSGGSVGSGGAIGSGGADGLGGETTAGDASDAAGFVSGGALDSAPGIYIVPAGPDTPEVRYPITNPSIKTDPGSQTDPGSFRIDYNMPALLVGGDQMVSLRGTLDAQGRIATVTGDAGSATCDLAPGDSFSVRCSETLSGIAVDLGEVQRMTQSLPAPMAALFVGVASRFLGEPIGVVEIR